MKNHSNNLLQCGIFFSSWIEFEPPVFPGATYNWWYRVCHEFRLTKRDDYFRVDFYHFWIKHYFWRRLGQYWKLAWALNRTTIWNLSLPKSMKRSIQIIDDDCSAWKLLRPSDIWWAEPTTSTTTGLKKFYEKWTQSCSTLFPQTKLGHSNDFW